MKEELKKDLEQLEKLVDQLYEKYPEHSAFFIGSAVQLEDGNGTVLGVSHGTADEFYCIFRTLFKKNAKIAIVLLDVIEHILLEGCSSDFEEILNIGVMKGIRRKVLSQNEEVQEQEAKQAVDKLLKEYYGQGQN